MIFCADSGLEVRDRLWLKITIKNAFIGSDVVDWLYDKVCNRATLKLGDVSFIIHSY